MVIIFALIDKAGSPHIKMDLDAYIESAESVMERTETCRGWLGDGIDVLVNCAAITYMEKMENQTVQGWQSVFRTNVLVPFALSQALLARTDKPVTVINIASMGVQVPTPTFGSLHVFQGSPSYDLLNHARILN